MIHRPNYRAGSDVAALLILSVAITGCGVGDSEATGDAALPVVPVAPATPPEGMSVAELRRQLGANPNAQFVRDGGTITEVELYDSAVKDLAPLRGLPLKRLGISGLPITSLAPLAGMPLEELTAEGTPVVDLEPLRDLPLRRLYLRETKVVDLAPLAGLPLEQLNVVGTGITSIDAVRDIPLDILWIASTSVTDLSPLAGKRLTSLDIEGTPVKDLAVLATMSSLQRLNIANSAVTDLSPLAGLQLQRLIFTPAKIERGLDVVRSMPSLREIGSNFESVQPAETFWQSLDGDAAPKPK